MNTRKNPLALLSFLRSLKCEYTLFAIEDAGSLALLPILKIVGAIAKGKKRLLVLPDLQTKPITYANAFTSFLKLFFASALSQISCYLSHKKLEKLAQLTHSKTSVKHPKNCLYINTNLWFGVKAGGSVGHIAGVANELENKGIHVTYASCTGRGLVSNKSTYLPLKLFGTFGLPTELNYYRFSEYAAKQLANEIKKNGKPDFIYQRLSISNYTGVSLAKRFKLPLVVEYNGSEVWVAKKWGRKLRKEKTAELAEEASLKHADFVVTISDVLRDELIERGIHPKQIITYPNGIDPEIFNPEKFSAKQNLQLRQQLNLSSNKKILTFVGTFGVWHGTDILAKTIQYLVENHEHELQETDAHFLLIGDGQKMPEVKSILKGKPMDYVTLTGLIPQTETPAYLAASDILLSPHVNNQDGSKFFGSPTKLFEYMAMQKLIIASGLEQLADVLSPSLHAKKLADDIHIDKETAILCEPGNIKELANSTLFALKNLDSLKELGKNARERAMQHYTWEKHVEQILSRIVCNT